jgi:CheY-like chemotaxis protein/KaiC/GvpD/RAD55 family RecA-like ATPase
MQKVLIADDEQNILMLTEVMFNEMGLNVITACNGEEAVEKALKEKPDLILTDIVMPKKDGFEVCREIRKSKSIANTPIIILSAMGDEYNKINGFEEGADDYVTKPFNIEELKARVKALLARSGTRPLTEKSDKKPQPEIVNEKMERLSTGIPELDKRLYGGLPKGSNILVLGPVGLGKSWFGRKFISTGLQNKEKNLFVAIDDDPKQIRKQLKNEFAQDIEKHEQNNLIKFVDAYSWSALCPPENESFAISGSLDLNQLGGVIADAGADLGQTVQQKNGGRRVLDSISSLLINFDLATVQKFITQIARTAVAFGGVTTLFILEKDTVDTLSLNNIKYLMDGIVEFSEIKDKRAVRVASMKWIKYSNEYCYL